MQTNIQNLKTFKKALRGYFSPFKQQKNIMICYQCDRPIRGFNYGFGVNPQCGKCYEEEQHRYQSKRNMDLENEKLKLEIKRLKRQLEK